MPMNHHCQTRSDPATLKIATIMMKINIYYILEVLWQKVNRCITFSVSCLFWINTQFCFRCRRFASKTDIDNWVWNEKRRSCVSLLCPLNQNKGRIYPHFNFLKYMYPANIHNAPLKMFVQYLYSISNSNYKKVYFILYYYIILYYIILYYIILYVYLESRIYSYFNWCLSMVKLYGHLCVVRADGVWSRVRTLEIKPCFMVRNR